MVFGSLADILYQWESMGIFDFVLPFLLVFAIVFGILSATKFMGENRAVYVIISVVIGLLSLRYQYFFSAFLSELFPRLGIGLAIIMALLILVGLFIAKDESRYWGYGLAAIGFVIALVIVLQTFDALGYGNYGGMGSDAIGFIILGLLLAGMIIAVAVSGRESHDRSKGLAEFISGWGGKHH
jgi:hypothetical protein